MALRDSATFLYLHKLLQLTTLLSCELCLGTYIWGRFVFAAQAEGWTGCICISLCAAGKNIPLWKSVFVGCQRIKQTWTNKSSLTKGLLLHTANGPGSSTDKAAVWPSALIRGAAMLTFVLHKADMLTARGKAVSASKDHSTRGGARYSLEIFKWSMQCLAPLTDNKK